MLEVDSNVPVGIMADWTFSRQEVTLPPGSTLFLYTDGLTEATRSDGQLFGDGRVLELLSSLDREMPVQEIIARMTRSVEAFEGDAEQSDDLTMLAVRLS
jgi:sigma-B regulation protein RsbU (phosphoserine phosphatase)